MSRLSTKSSIGSFHSPVSEPNGRSPNEREESSPNEREESTQNEREDRSPNEREEHEEPSPANDVEKEQSPKGLHVDQDSPLWEDDLDQRSEEDDASYMENKLIVPVEGLLEGMNAIAGILNQKEGELHAFDHQRRAVAHEWKETKTRLVLEIGVPTIERVRPLMDLHLERQAAQDAVSAATHDYAEAAAACVEIRAQLATCSGESDQQLMDRLVTQTTAKEAIERFSLEKTNEFNAIQTQIAQLKAEIGSRVFQRAWPWFEAYTQTRTASERLGKSIKQLRAEMHTLKAQYRAQMSELEAISTQVHILRTSQA